MLFDLDLSNLHHSDDEVYSAHLNSRVYVFIDGVELKRCIYCNVTKGFAICIKEDMKGNIVVSEGNIIHELRFGSIEVQPMKSTQIKK